MRSAKPELLEVGLQGLEPFRHIRANLGVHAIHAQIFPDAFLASLPKANLLKFYECRRILQRQRSIQFS